MRYSGHQTSNEYKFPNQDAVQPLNNSPRRPLPFVSDTGNCQNAVGMQKRRSACEVLAGIFCSGLILKFFTCACFGILPWNFKRHTKKQNYAYITVFLSIMHWSCFLSYVYFVSTYWSKSEYNCEMPSTVKVIQIGLVASGAFNLVIFAWFLYSGKNDFSDDNCQNFNLIPQIQYNLTMNEGSDHPGLSKSDWLITNVFLVVGFCCSSFVIFVDFSYNIFYSFSGIHSFLSLLSPWQKLHYHISVSTEFFGFFSTACAICVFHLITVDLIQHIDHTENYILHTAKDRDDFQRAHNQLLQYGRNLLQSIRWWFNIHTMFFFFLVTAMTFEWLQFLERKGNERADRYKLMLSQISGSLFIAYKFAFPFLSAGRVTARYSAFYYAIARWSRIPYLPKIALMSERSGIKVIGIRITTNIAIIAFLCSFLGALKLVTGWKE